MGPRLLRDSHMSFGVVAEAMRPSEGPSFRPRTRPARLIASGEAPSYYLASLGGPERRAFFFGSRDVAAARSAGSDRHPYRYPNRGEVGREWSHHAAPADPHLRPLLHVPYPSPAQSPATAAILARSAA